MAADVGPAIEEYNVPLDYPALYKWIVGNTATADSVAVIAHNGGTVGRWHLVRLPVKGADLGDASVTLTVGGNRWRRIPAATLGANRILTLGTANAAAGDMLTVTRLDTGAFTVAINNGGPAAGTLTTLPVSARWWAAFYFDGTNWLLHSAGQMP